MLINILLSLWCLTIPVRADDWISFEASSRLFKAQRPSSGWFLQEEEDALGPITRLIGPNDESGLLRTTISVRLIDHDNPNYLPLKEAIEKLRHSNSDFEVSPVRTLRVDAGLVRLLEIDETKSLPTETGPSVQVSVHQYLAYLAHGQAYFLVRMISTKENYLSYREDFIRFLKSFRP